MFKSVGIAGQSISNLQERLCTSPKFQLTPALYCTGLLFIINLIEKGLNENKAVDFTESL